MSIQNPNLQADIAADLDVMFSDLDTGARINGDVVTGWFSSGDSGFMDSSVPSFEAPHERLKDVRREDAVEISGIDYRVVDIEFPAGRIRLVLGQV